MWSQQLEDVGAQPVEAAVADVRHPGLSFGLEQQRDHRGSHAAQLGVVHRHLVDALIGGLEGAAQHRVRVVVEVREDGADRLDGGSAGGLARLVSAHAVGQHQQAMARGMTELLAVVLVAGADAADVAQRGRCDLGRGHAGSLPQRADVGSRRSTSSGWRAAPACAWVRRTSSAQRAAGAHRPGRGELARARSMKGRRTWEIPAGRQPGRSPEHDDARRRDRTDSRQAGRVAGPGIRAERSRNVAIEDRLAPITAGALDGLVAEASQSIGQRLENIAGRLHVPVLLDVGLDLGGDDEHFL
jgi:hypothetical protein